MSNDLAKARSILKLSRAKLSDPGSDPVTVPTLPFAEATAEIAGALHIKSDVAELTLYGLCATGRVGWVNDQSELIDEECCTIAELARSPPLAVIACDVRSFLTGVSPNPQPSMREGVIRELLDEGRNPPRNIRWKEFCERVRERCHGWLRPGQPALGFSDKQIWRIVKDIRAE